MLTPSPECHDARGRRITCVGIVVGHDQARDRYEPIGRASVARPSHVAPQDGVFHVRSRDAQEISLHNRVIRPDYDPR